MPAKAKIDSPINGLKPLRMRRIKIPPSRSDTARRPWLLKEMWEVRLGRPGTNHADHALRVRCRTLAGDSRQSGYAERRSTRMCSPDHMKVGSSEENRGWIRVLAACQ